VITLSAHGSKVPVYKSPKMTAKMGNIEVYTSFDISTNLCTNTAW